MWQHEAKGAGSIADIKAHLPQCTIGAIGHRVVFGGKYIQTTRIDREVLTEIERNCELAPLHNKIDLHTITEAQQLFPHIPHFAVFDSAFHTTIPLPAAIYPIPYEWTQSGIRRFGFHGISYQYCAKKAAMLLKHIPKKMVICHLGSGASLCALENGKSIDTTMGFTPLEGLMMDTRSGSIDPGILLYLLQKKHLSPDTLAKALNEQSGLLGVFGRSGDMRETLAARRDNDRAHLALEIYLHRLASQIGAMIGSLGGLDCLVFTAGIGEHAPLIRERICKQLAFLHIDLASHQIDGQDAILSTPHSKTTVLLIHTQEAFEIARECHELMALS